MLRLLTTLWIYELLIRPKDSCDIRLVPHFGAITEQGTSNPTVPSVSPGSQHCKRYPLMAALTMTDSQQVIVTVTATDKKNQPVPLPAGTVVATSDAENVVTAVVNPDGTVTFTAAGVVGSATGSVTVNDATGTALASGSIDFTIISGAPTKLVLTPGAPTEQP